MLKEVINTLAPLREPQDFRSRTAAGTFLIYSSQGCYKEPRYTLYIEMLITPFNIRATARMIQQIAGE